MTSNKQSQERQTDQTHSLVLPQVFCYISTLQLPQTTENMFKLFHFIYLFIHFMLQLQIENKSVRNVQQALYKWKKLEAKVVTPLNG